MVQPSGAGFIAVDKILKDLTSRGGLENAWENIDEDIRGEIKHRWASLITEVLDQQAAVLKHQNENKAGVERDLDRLAEEFKIDLGACNLAHDGYNNIVKLKNSKLNVGLSPAFALYVYARTRGE